MTSHQKTQTTISEPAQNPKMETALFDTLCEMARDDERKQKRQVKRLQNKLQTAQSTDGVDPLYNSGDIPAEFAKKIHNQDKQFKKQQRTKALNIINQCTILNQSELSR